MLGEGGGVMVNNRAEDRKPMRQDALRTKRSSPDDKHNVFRLFRL